MSSSSSSSEMSSSSSTPEYINKYITPANTDSEIANNIINYLVYPQIFMFCEIQVHYEVGTRMRDGSYKFTYGNWNKAYEPQVFLNGADTQLNPSLYTINYERGIITPNFQTTSGDNMICTYNFAWFTDKMIYSYLERSMASINFHGSGATTSYTLETMPETFYGIAADLAVAMCCENLILSTTMWIGRLVFAISNNDMYNGGGDISSQLETIKHNCEDRAYATLQNEKTRAPNSIARPTPAYWRAIMTGNGIKTSPHGKQDWAKLQGHKFNKFYGFTGGDVNDLDI